MACRRGPLSTIYSVGEGRTIVLATDGCRICVQAFAALVRSASQADAEDSESRHRGEREGQPRAKSLQRGSSDHPSSVRSRGMDRTEASFQWGPHVRGKPRQRTPHLTIGSIGEEAQGMALAELSPAGGESPKVLAPSPRHLVVFDAEVPEEDREEQELTLRASDRLIVALYTPPWQIPLLLSSPQEPTSPGQENRRLRSFNFRTLPTPNLPAALGGLWGIKKQAEGPEHKPGKSHGDASPTELSPRAPKAQGPRVGPGHTSLFTPMSAWDDVAKTISQWEGATSRDCLTRMAQAARDAKVRFEAIRVQEQQPPNKEGGGVSLSISLPPPSHMLGPPKRHSFALGHSLNLFCDKVEAKMLLLGTHHSMPVIDFNPKSFSQHLVEYCAQHCRCSVRVIAQDRSGLSEESPRSKSVRESPRARSMATALAL